MPTATDDLLEAPAEDELYCPEGHLKVEHVDLKTDATELRCFKCERQVGKQVSQRRAAERSKEAKQTEPLGPPCACRCGQRCWSPNATYVRGHSIKRKGNGMSGSGYIDPALAGAPCTARCMRCGWSQRTTGGNAGAAFLAHQTDCPGAVAA